MSVVIRMFSINSMFGKRAHCLELELGENRQRLNFLNMFYTCEKDYVNEVFSPCL